MKVVGPNSNLANDGLRALVLESRPALLRFLLARRVPADEAEDILQDLFVKVEELKVGPVSEPRAYLYRMAENLVLDRRRSAGRRSSREQAWVAARSSDDLEADDRPTAEHILIARERLTRISEALAALPERTIHIFRRFRIDDVPQKAIATDLGISLSAVEKHLQKAYHALVEAQARLDADDGPPQRPYAERESR